jgi:molybdopterin molybdotransferase
MITFEQALALVLRHSRPLPVEIVALDEALGRVLARAVRASFALPLFDNSSVDGFAVRHRELRPGASLPVAFTQAAGAAPRALPRRAAARIFTGAVLPAGADTVVMQEDAAVAGDAVSFRAVPARGANVRPRGGEFARGAMALPAGAPLTPAAIGLAASLGVRRVAVRRAPRVALLVTGDEIKPATARLKPGEVHDANGAALAAALRADGLTPVAVWHAPDRPAALWVALRALLAAADVVITTGGASVGAADFIPGLFHELGARLRFHGVAMKPGKPVAFATRGDQLVFALPGNPVSALVTFLLLVRPALRARMGHESPAGLTATAVLTDPLKKAPGREEFVRARLSAGPGGAWRATPCRGQGSHMLGGLARADALIRFPAAARMLRAGARVEAIPLPWARA